MTAPESNEHEDHEFDLVMPFVTVRSVGGPHDDAPYAAGWAMGALDKQLTQCALVDVRAVSFVIRTDCRAQADLIAMQHDYTMTVTAGGQEWISVEFTRD